MFSDCTIKSLFNYYFNIILKPNSNNDFVCYHLPFMLCNFYISGCHEDSVAELHAIIVLSFYPTIFSETLDSISITSYTTLFTLYNFISLYTNQLTYRALFTFMCEWPAACPETEF